MGGAARPRVDSALRLHSSPHRARAPARTAARAPPPQAYLNEMLRNAGGGREAVDAFLRRGLDPSAAARGGATAQVRTRHPSDDGAASPSRGSKWKHSVAFGMAELDAVHRPSGAEPATAASGAGAAAMEELKNRDNKIGEYKKNLTDVAEKIHFY